MSSVQNAPDLTSPLQGSFLTDSKWTLIAALVGAVAGAILIGLGAAQVFGAAGTMGFIDALAGGGVLSVLSCAGVAWIAIASCKKANEAEESDTEGLSSTGAEPIGEDLTASLEYPTVGQEALEFARQKLHEFPDVEPFVFSAGYHDAASTHQPVNPEIASLYALLAKHFVSSLFKKLEEAKDSNPWERDDVIEAADDMLKMAYAISCLTLEDLSDFKETLERESIERTNAKCLTTQDSYQYRTFFHCTQAYHNLRGAIAWLPNQWTKEEGLNYPQEVLAKHADLFYAGDTAQSRWRELYNDYCARVRHYVDEEELRRADQRFVLWTQMDKGVESFRQTPTTLPT